MTGNARYSGLCETCDHDATCTLRRSTQLQIIQCEEFSVHSAVSHDASREHGPAVPVPDASVMGLCANCLNVATCGFPSARRGVLQCEEYVLDEAGTVPPVQSDRSRSAA